MAHKHGWDIPECPDGNVFGPTTKRVQLVAPNGNVQKENNIPIEDDPIEWAKEEHEKLKAQPTGDGGTLADYPHIFEGIFGSGPWELREFDGTYKSGFCHDIENTFED